MTKSQYFWLVADDDWGGEDGTGKKEAKHKADTMSDFYPGDRQIKFQ